MDYYNSDKKSRKSRGTEYSIREESEPAGHNEPPTHTRSRRVHARNVYYRDCCIVVADLKTRSNRVDERARMNEYEINADVRLYRRDVYGRRYEDILDSRIGSGPTNESRHAVYTVIGGAESVKLTDGSTWVAVLSYFIIYCRLHHGGCRGLPTTFISSSSGHKINNAIYKCRPPLGIYFEMSRMK